MSQSLNRKQPMAHIQPAFALKDEAWRFSRLRLIVLQQEFMKGLFCVYKSVDDLRSYMHMMVL